VVPNQYKPFLLQIRPQYLGAAADTPENVLWFTGGEAGGYTTGQLQAIQAVFDQYWADLWKLPATSVYTYKSSIVTDWTSDTGPQIPVNSAVSTIGTQSGVCGANVAVLISLQLALRYRGGHPRIYLPGIGSEALQDSRTLDSTLVGEMVTAYNTFQDEMAAISSAEGGPCYLVAYRYRNTEGKAEIVPLADAVIQSELASQRRRLRRVTRK
jgi:hypothetical protein